MVAIRLSGSTSKSTRSSRRYVTDSFRIASAITRDQFGLNGFVLTEGKRVAAGDGEVILREPDGPVAAGRRGWPRRVVDDRAAPRASSCARRLARSSLHTEDSCADQISSSDPINRIIGSLPQRETMASWNRRALGTYWETSPNCSVCRRSQPPGTAPPRSSGPRGPHTSPHRSARGTAMPSLTSAGVAERV